MGWYFPLILLSYWRNTMRITSTDIHVISSLAKRVVTGCLVGGKYILSGHDASTQSSVEIPKEAIADTSKINKRRVRQQPRLVIEDNVYEVPAMVRLKKVKLADWQKEHLQPSVIDEAIKQHYDYMTANGLKPGSLYLYV